jgi:hypothetical protein
MKIADRFKTLDDIYDIDTLDLTSLSETEIVYLSNWMMVLIMLSVRNF